MIKRIYRIIPLVMIFVLCGAIAMASGGGEGGSEGKSQWVTMGFRIVNFVLLIGLLWYLLAAKIKGFFGGRRQEIIDTFNDLEEGKVKAADNCANIESKIVNVEKDIAEIRQMLIGELENDKARIIEEGKQAANRIIEQAKLSAEQEIVKAKKNLRDNAVDLSVDMANTMIEKSISSDDQKKLIGDYLLKVVR